MPSEEHRELVFQGQHPPSGASWTGRKPATEAGRTPSGNCGWKVRESSSGSAREALKHNRGSRSKAVSWEILSSKSRQGPFLVHRARPIQLGHSEYTEQVLDFSTHLFILRWAT